MGEKGLEYEEDWQTKEPRRRGKKKKEVLTRSYYSRRRNIREKGL